MPTVGSLRTFYMLFSHPRAARDARGYRRRHAKCTMNLDEVVGEIV
jgi:hypothetical protein